MPHQPPPTDRATGARAVDLEQLHREHHAASEDERTLWAVVKGRHPGQAGHDAQAWRAWLASAHRVQALARVIRELEHGR